MTLPEGSKHSPPLHANSTSKGHPGGRASVMARSLSFVNNKMAGKRSLLAQNSVFLSLASLAAVFQCYGLLLSMLIAQRHRQGCLTFQAANQYSIALAKKNCLSSRKSLEEAWKN